MGFGFGLLRCWMLDSGWVEMVGGISLFLFSWSCCIHIEKTIHTEVCGNHCLAGSRAVDESGAFVLFGQDSPGQRQ
jgi:hypothetical protein